MTAKPILKDDRMVLEELKVAGIEKVDHCQPLEGEIETRYSGKLGNFSFRRAWNYWVVEGEVPLPTARELFSSTYGRNIRAQSRHDDLYAWKDDGFKLGIAERGSWVTVKPTEKGPMVICYHIDVFEPEALKFFVKFLKDHHLV